MESEPGRSLILWTVRIAVFCYLAAIWIYHTAEPEFARRLQAWRLLWSTSWLLVIVHVICAFHYEHQWSHTAALQHTAEMTERVVGWYWSGGLYINYAFLLLWGADAASVLFRCSRTSLAMHWVAAFMMFNATAVFGPAWWIPLAGGYILAILSAVRRSRRYSAD